jgi:diguanylate cyclase (GGDEF)-like protein
MYLQKDYIMNDSDNEKTDGAANSSTRQIDDADSATESSSVQGVSDIRQKMKQRKVNILRDVGVESIFGMLEHCHVISLEPEQVLLKKGQLNQTMFIILNGELSIHLESPKSDCVAVLGEGQSVGELSVIDGTPASAFVIAKKQSRLVAIDEDTFWRMVRASHDFSANMLLLLAQRMRANNATVSHTIKLKNKYERDALHDALTSLYNRRWLDTRLPRLMSRYVGNGKPFSVAIIDVDHFKSFNDKYGHSAGDQVLATLGTIMINQLRVTDLHARYGGEEFVALLPDTPLPGALVAADRLRIAVSKENIKTIEGVDLPPITISIGVAAAIENETAVQLLERADHALYRAKENGRNRVECAGM